jgi:hypothetical protein
MPDDEDVLDQPVDEAKDAIRSMDDPDYADLLEREKDGKDRKTMREWLESRTKDGESSEDSGAEQTTVEQSKDAEGGSREDGETEDRDGPVSRLKSMSPLQLLVAGGFLGLLLGLAAGMNAGGGAGGSPAQASSNLEAIITSGGFNGTVDLGQPKQRHGLYYYNVSLTREGPNGTAQTQYQAAYMSRDGELLFPVIQGSPFAPTTPIEVESALQRQRTATGEATGEAPAANTTP